MNNCLFCKIIKNEIPATKVFDNEFVLGFVDLQPTAKVHVLFIHKNHTSNINEMSSDPTALGQIFQAIKSWSQKEKLDQAGFRVVTNNGANAGQTIFHTHFHVLGGEKLGSFGR